MDPLRLLSVSLIALDLDGTLVDQAVAARAWASEFGAEWDLEPEHSARIGHALTARKPKGKVFAELAQEWHLPLAGDDAWRMYRSRMPELVACADADKDALRALRAADWRLGIVTNGMTDNQEAKIIRTGLAELVDGWVISEAVGYRKPDPRIFSSLAERLGCPLDGWMIGDSLEHDVAGGKAAGLRTMWITGHLGACADGMNAAASVAEAVRRILAAPEA